MQMFRRQVLLGALLRLITVAVLVGGARERQGSTAAAPCRHQLVFDAYDGYACDVIVTSSSSDDDAAAVVVVVVDGDGRVPSNVTALRLTLRRAAAATQQTGSRLTRLRQLLSLEVDVAETGSFPVGLLPTLGATSLLRLSVFRSASTDVSEFRLHLPTMSEGTFAASNGSLSTVVLSHLGIDDLPPNTFHALTTLCFLFLDNNRLSSLPGGLFDDLCQLSSLSLARNRFVDVQDLSLTGSGRPVRRRCGRGLARLRTLDLHDNRLRRLTAGAFRSLRSVVEINLSGNQLSVVEAGAFSGLDALRTLYIDGNRLTGVAPAMFDGPAALTTLDLGRNRLSDVASGAFRYLASLRVLRLHDNEIAMIRRDAWTGLDQLTELDLAANRLTELDRSTFSGLCSLRQLDLSNNRLTLARSDAFVCLTTLERLYLSDNPLSDGERRRLEERQWWSKGVGTALCEVCVNASLTTTSAQINCGQSVSAVGLCHSRASSSSLVVVRPRTARILAVALTVGAAVGVLLLLTLAAAHLLSRRRALLVCRSTTSTYSPRSATASNLDGSIHGMYVKFHT